MSEAARSGGFLSLDQKRDRAERLRAGGLAGLREASGPVSLAGERFLPVSSALEPLVGAGLKRGTVLSVSDGPGGTSLVLSLVAEATRRGSWAVFMGASELGLVAAHEQGVVLERCVVVDAADRRTWPKVVGNLIGAFDLIVVGSGPRRRPRDLEARLRESGTTMVCLGTDLAGSRADLVLEITGSEWVGLGQGSGRLSGRRVEVSVTGRGAAGRERRVVLWMPPTDGSGADVESSLGSRPDVGPSVPGPGVAELVS